MQHNAKLSSHIAAGEHCILPMGFIPLPSLRFWEQVCTQSNTCDNTIYLSLFLNSVHEVE